MLPTDDSELTNPEPESIDLGDLLADEQNDEPPYAHFIDSNNDQYHHHHGDYDNDNSYDDNPQAAGGGDRSPIRHAIGQHPRKFSRVDTPLRVEPPPSFNAPARPADRTTEQQIKVSERFLSFFWRTISALS